MMYLAGAIIFSSWLVIAFKIAERFGISAFQSIIFNYLTCTITGICLEGSFPSIHQLVNASWFPWALLMGAMFISVFNLVAYTTKKAGVAIASVASKLSLVIPFVFSILLYHEVVTYSKATGILLALVSVTLTCWPAEKKRAESGKISYQVMLTPLILFIGSGLMDTLIKYVEQHFINTENNNLYILTAFSVAGFIGGLILVGSILLGKERFDFRSVIAGVIIGVPNYFSLWCLVHVLKSYSGNSSAIIPITNMGIVLFSTLSAVLFFRERLQRINWIGILLSVLAIYLIALA